MAGSAFMLRFRIFLAEVGHLKEQCHKKSIAFHYFPQREKIFHNGVRTIKNMPTDWPHLAPSRMPIRVQTIPELTNLMLS